MAEAAVVVEEVVDFQVVADSPVQVEAAAFPAVAAVFREAARREVDLSGAAGVRQANRVFQPAAPPAAALSAARDRLGAEERAWARADLVRPVVWANPAGREALKESKVAHLVVKRVATSLLKAARPVVRLNPVVPEEEATRPRKVVPQAARAQALHHRAAARQGRRLQVVVPQGHRLPAAHPQATTITTTGMTTGAGWQPRAWPPPPP